MSQLRRSKGFTLIELLVVVIIVAILAAVGVPLLSANVERARASEAEAGLGTIRTAMRARFAEFGKYDNATLTNIGLRITANDPKGGDLDGRFFEDDVYSVQAAVSNTFCVQVDGTLAGNGAPKAADVTTLKRSMNQDGTIFDNTACGGNQLN